MEPFSQDEEHRLRQEVAGGSTASCPRCGGPLEEAGVPPRADVAYVRDRVWLLCPVCARMAIFDRRKTE